MKKKKKKKKKKKTAKEKTALCFLLLPRSLFLARTMNLTGAAAETRR